MKYFIVRNNSFLDNDQNLEYLIEWKHHLEFFQWESCVYYVCAKQGAPVKPSFKNPPPVFFNSKEEAEKVLEIIKAHDNPCLKKLLISERAYYLVPVKDLKRLTIDQFWQKNSEKF